MPAVSAAGVIAGAAEAPVWTYAPGRVSSRTKRLQRGGGEEQSRQAQAADDGAAVALFR